MITKSHQLKNIQRKAKINLQCTFSVAKIALQHVKKFLTYCTKMYKKLNLSSSYHNDELSENIEIECRPTLITKAVRCWRCVNLSLGLPGNEPGYNSAGHGRLLSLKTLSF